jgi:hypothetical protein
MARHQGSIPWSDLVTRWYSIEKSGEALRAVAERTVLKAGIRPDGAGGPSARTA